MSCARGPSRLLPSAMNAVACTTLCGRFGRAGAGRALLRRRRLSASTRTAAALAGAGIRNQHRSALLFGGMLELLPPRAQLGVDLAAFTTQPQEVVTGAKAR